MKKLLFILFVFSCAPPTQGDYFDGLKCNQKLPKLKHPEIVFTDETFAFYWYKSNNTHEKIGNIEAEYASYIFWNDRFFGKVYAITGKDNINEVLRNFTKEVEQLYNNDPKNSA